MNGTGDTMLLIAMLAAGAGVMYVTHRSHKRCVTCRRLFPSVAERATHEHKAHTR